MTLLKRKANMNINNLLPNLTPDQHEALSVSITEDGILSPIIVDQYGDLIDGFARQAICNNLNIDCPRIVQHFESDEERIRVRLAVNVARRQMNSQQKRTVIELYLKYDAAISNNHLGEILGVSENTVKSVREELESTSQIAKLERFRGKDGKVRRKNRRIFTNNRKESEKAKQFIEKIPAGNNILSLPVARKRANMAQAIPEINEDAWTQREDDQICILHCSFQQLKEKSSLKSGSVQLVLTDPPYERAWMDQWDELGKLANDVLHNGGLLVTHCGIHFLPEVISSLGRHLTYRWTISTSWNAAGNQQFVGGKSILNKWLPILVFSKGTPHFAKGFCDMIQFEGQEKTHHKWQQPLEIFQRLVNDFSKVGDLVVDPCGGSFTTAIACAQSESRRRFIGCDIDEHSVRIGQQRLAEEFAQIDTPIRSGKRLGKLGVRIYNDPKPMPFNCSDKRRAVEENRFQDVTA